jgi:hypothetical protein
MAPQLPSFTSCVEVPESVAVRFWKSPTASRRRNPKLQELPKWVAGQIRCEPCLPKSGQCQRIPQQAFAFNSFALAVLA